MPFFTGLVLALVWFIDTVWEHWCRPYVVSVTPPRSTTPPPRARHVTAPVVPPSEQAHWPMINERHQERARLMQESLAVTAMLCTIDTERYPVRWAQAQDVAAQEFVTRTGLAYWERARDIFLALGEQHADDRATLNHRFPVGHAVAVQPAATVSHDNMLAPDDEAIWNRLYGWLDEEDAC